MNKARLYIDGLYLERINKRTARTEFNKGTQLLIIPCKANPYHVMWRGYQFNKNMLLHTSFDSLCVALTFYNCNSECGMYLCYYIVEDRKGV